MHRLVRLLSRWLLAVLLATVLSPSFGWQALEGMSTHEHGEEALVVHTAGSSVDDEHAHAGCPGHDTAAAETVHDAVDHCCPGHVLGHLLGGVGSNGLLLPAADGSAGIDMLASTFSSRIPEGLDRPPRHAA